VGPVGRRQLLIAAGALLGALAAPAGAQSAAPGLPRVVIVTTGDETGHAPYKESFLKGMREAGQIEGRTYRLEIKHADRNPQRDPGLIRDAVAARPDVLVVYGLAAARSAHQATTTIAVVVATSSDLVDGGVVKSFAHPGGNITGINDLADEAAVKRLELLKEALPRASRVALLVDPGFPATPKIERSVGKAALTFGIEIIPVQASDPAALSAALDSLEQSHPDALLVGAGTLLVVRAKALIERANAMHIPVVHYWPGTAEMGALISHQADIFHNVERAAYYVARILKGAKPADLPIEQPNHYDLVVNAGIAKAFGIELPAAFLVHADRVIE
jgi:putative ABC transport system substrate-binding protein